MDPDEKNIDRDNICITPPVTLLPEGQVWLVEKLNYIEFRFTRQLAHSPNKTWSIHLFV
jgi:hypothetical protein